MTWSTLRSHAQQMGFDLACRTRLADGGGFVPDLHSPPDTGHWICVGSYDQAAGVWLQPVTDDARRCPVEQVSAAMASRLPFLAPLGAYDADFSDDFLDANRPGLSAAANPDAGRMPA